MVCNSCGQNEASIHLTEIMNNQMVEIHLCETCAEQKGTDFKAHFDFTKLLASLADFGQTLTPEETLKLVCPSCGMTSEEFGRTGRLGCSHCYDSFDKLLIPLLKRVQKDVRHVGKVPEQASHTVKRAVNIRQLNERLQKCIENEQFEQAAELRDEIAQMEKKKNGNGKKKAPKDS